MKSKTAIVITGPTASGKSALAIELAKKLNTEIISADSRQIYKGIPIVTALPTPSELREVKHHLLDFLPLENYYSASLFEQDSLRIANDIFERNDYVVVCGGSMMYIDTFCKGIDELPTVPDDIRNSLMKVWKDKGREKLLSMLKELDPAYYDKVDLNNTKRIFHAVEISLTAGKPYSSLLKGEKKSRPFKIFKYSLEPPREILFDRINQRVDMMVKTGLEEEARNVYQRKGLNSLNTVGLKEMFSYFEGNMQKEEAIERIKKNTRVYAKKQITWYKKDSEIIKLDPTSGNEFMIEKVLTDITEGEVTQKIRHNS